MSSNTSNPQAMPDAEADLEALGEEPNADAPPHDAQSDHGEREVSPDDGPAPSGSRDEADARARVDDDEAPRSDPPDASNLTKEELEREVDQLNDRHLRLAAEFENYRKRVRAEQRDTWARAQADLVRRLVESVDDLQRVALLDPQTASVRDIVEGVDLVERKLLRALADAGLEVLDPAGENFDPNVMEAVMMAPATSEDEDDTVDMVMQRGYVLGGHLVRPARVSVRKHG